MKLSIKLLYSALLIILLNISNASYSAGMNTDTCPIPPTDIYSSTTSEEQLSEDKIKETIRQLNTEDRVYLRQLLELKIEELNEKNTPSSLVLQSNHKNEPTIVDLVQDEIINDISSKDFRYEIGFSALKNIDEDQKKSTKDNFLNISRSKDLDRLAQRYAIEIERCRKLQKPFKDQPQNHQDRELDTANVNSELPIQNTNELMRAMISQLNLFLDDEPKYDIVSAISGSVTVKKDRYDVTDIQTAKEVSRKLISSYEEKISKAEYDALTKTADSIGANISLYSNGEFRYIIILGKKKPEPPKRKRIPILIIEDI